MLLQLAVRMLHVIAAASDASAAVAAVVVIGLTKSKKSTQLGAHQSHMIIIIHVVVAGAP